MASEEQAADDAARQDDPAGDARRWLLEVTHGSLATLSAKPELLGYPFGSVVPFGLTKEGAPILYLARIAAHSANLRRDARASLLVQQPVAGDGDPQSGWRVTLCGRLELVDDDDEEADELFARYRERVPGAAQYRGTHDFQLWVMRSIEKVRYIAGFGKICWLDGAELRRAPLDDGAVTGAVAHMNKDHVENMREMCAGLYGVRPAHVEMRALDRAGFLVETKEPDALLSFSFGRELAAAAELRRGVIDVLARARARL